MPDKEPFRTQLEFIRLDFFAQIYIRELSKSIMIKEEDYQEYYDANTARFEERSVSGIYIDYSLDPEKAPAVDGKHPLSENEARIKAKDLVARIQAGADFAELAKQHSTDSTSAKKGGELGSFKHNAKIPAPLKDVIFSLEPGGTSDARQHGGRFYIFRVTAVDVEPMSEVKNDMAGRIQATKLRQKVNEIRGALKNRYSQRSLHETEADAAWRARTVPPERPQHSAASEPLTRVSRHLTAKDRDRPATTKTFGLPGRFRTQCLVRLRPLSIPRGYHESGGFS